MSDRVSGSVSSARRPRPTDGARVPGQRAETEPRLPPPQQGWSPSRIPWALVLLSAIFVMVVLGSLFSYIVEHG